MTKFERITAALGALPEARREEIAAIIETMFYADLHPGERSRSEAQTVDFRPPAAAPVGVDAEIEAIVRRFRA